MATKKPKLIVPKLNAAAKNGAAKNAAVKGAYDQLAVDPAKVTPHSWLTVQVTAMMRTAKLDHLGLPGDPYFYLRSATGETARKVTGAYDSIAECYRKHLPLEAFCVAADVPPDEVADILAASIARIQRRMVAVKFSGAHSTVVDATIKAALGDEALAKNGHRDRIAIHKIMGALPVPKGAQTIVNVQQNSAHTAQAFVPAPPPEATVRRLSERMAADRIAAPADPVIDVEAEDPDDEADES